MSGLEIVVRSLVIAAVGLAVISPALPGGFVWDDILIPQGRYVTAADGLWKFWTTSLQPDYWPVAYSTHWFEYRVFGNWAPGYRGFNVALHIGNALLIWRLLTMLRVPGAWWAALVFVAHPVTVEAVAWILQRKTLLSTFFGLGTFIAYLHYRAAPADWRKWCWFAAALVLFALGMLSKTAVVVLPLAMPAVVWLLDRRVNLDDLWLLAPLLGIAIVLGYVAWDFQQTNAIGRDIVRDDSPVSRVALAGRSFWFYIFQALWPANLMFIYPRWPLGIAGPQTFVPLLALLALAGGLIFATIARWPDRGSWCVAPLAALLWYGLNLVPVSGLANIYFMRYSLVADHWQYLSLPALVALVVAGVVTGAAKLSQRQPGWLVSVALAALVLVFALLSFNQAEVYAGKDNRPLWLDTIAKNPDAWIAYNNLGTLLNQDGETAMNAAKRAAAEGRIEEANQLGRSATQSFDDAASQFRRALELNPKYSDAEQNWGMNLLVQGRYAEAMQHFQHALEISPPKTTERAKAHVYLGIVLRTTGHADEALPHFQAAVADVPHYVQANEELGQALLAAGRPREAEKPLKTALAVNPNLVNCQVRLGEVYYQLQRLEEAIGAFEKALQLDDNQPDVHRNLAILLAMRRAFEPAIAHYRQALMRDPGNIPARLGLGVALAEMGRLGEAISEYEKVLTLAPDAIDARTNLANALLMAGRHKEALAQYEETLQRNADFLPARLNYASALSDRGRWRDAVVQFRLVLNKEPANQGAMQQLAWLLATAPDDAVRDSAQAVTLAEAMCGATLSPDARQLDVLAAALASAGRYAEALPPINEAISRLQAAGRPEVKELIERRKLYEANQPYRMPEVKR
jgi:tetratricopeptide (TPR) repeat protein